MHKSTSCRLSSSSSSGLMKKSSVLSSSSSSSSASRPAPAFNSAATTSKDLKTRHLPSHRDSHKPSMSRRFSFPRGGALEESRLLAKKSKMASELEPLPYAPKTFASTDCMSGLTGTLDYWRHAVMKPGTQNYGASMYRHFGTVPPQWDVVVPLLEKIREAGRSTFWKDTSENNLRSPIGGMHSNPLPSIFFEQQHLQKHEAGSQNEAAFCGSSSVLMKNGDKITPEALQKQLLVELYVRLPLLEQTLDTTATPILVAKLCNTLHYCDIAVPTSESFTTGIDASQGLRNSKLRLRCLLIAALRKTELDLMKEHMEQNTSKAPETELRKRRRMALTVRDTNGLYDFLQANKSVFMDCTQEQLQSVFDASKQGGECDLSLVSIDIEKEVPNVWRWAKEGKEFVRKSTSNSSSSNSSPESQQESTADDITAIRFTRAALSATKPVNWLPEGMMTGSDNQIEEEELEMVRIEASGKSEDKKQMKME